MTQNEKAFENTVGKGESIGSKNVFYFPQNISQFFSYIYFVICKCFQFGPVQILLFGKELIV